MQLRNLAQCKEQAQDSQQRLRTEGKKDTFYNKVGKDKKGLIILASAFVSFFLIARLIRKYMKKELKQFNLQLLFPLGAAGFSSQFFSICCSIHCI